MDVNSLLSSEYGVVAVPFVVNETQSTVSLPASSQEEVQWLPDNNSVLLTFSTINSLPLDKNQDVEGATAFLPCVPTSLYLASDGTIVSGPLDGSPSTVALLDPTDSPRTVTLVDSIDSPHTVTLLEPTGTADSPQTTIIDIADPASLAGIFEPTSQDNSPLPSLAEEVSCTEESIVDNGKSTMLNDFLLDDVAEVVTVVKCKLCDFHCQTKEQVAEHLTEEHCDRPPAPKGNDQTKRNPKCNKKESSVGRTAKRIKSENVPTDKETSDKDTADEEDDKRLPNVFFSCGSCRKVCSSMGELRKHMNEIHLSKEYLQMEINYSPNAATDDIVDNQSTIVEGPSSPGDNNNEGLDCRRRLSMSSVSEMVTVESLPNEAVVDGKNKQDELRVEAHVEPEIVILEKPFAGLQKELKFQCRQCNVKLSSMANLEKHLKCHSADGSPLKFKCSICERPFKRWLYCSGHLWLAHKIDIDLYSCPVCDYKNAHRDRFIIHEKRHRLLKEFACRYCAKKFSQKTQLRNHEVLHLKKVSNATLPEWAKKKQCELCGKSFCDSKALKKHIKTVHSKLKPYVCQVCGHCSARKGMFQLHIRQHTGDKPYACTVCEFTTRDHNSLRRHMMRHTGVRQYQCKFCPYSAIQSVLYKGHLLKYHDGEGVFVCPTCSYSTVNEQAFHYHKHDEEPKVDKTKNDKPTLIYVPFNEKDSSNKSGSGELIAINLPDDDESNNYFDQTVDTGGITIAEDIETSDHREEISSLCLESSQGDFNILEMPCGQENGHELL